jgi:hypothetical protein
MWKEKIIEINKECTFYGGALESDLLEVEEKLNTKLPVQLKEVLLETDGVTAEYGERLIWSASEIIKHNIEFRENSDFKELYMPFDHLLFFGDGGGDQFAYGIIDGEVKNEYNIYRWDHETDGRCWDSFWLDQYFEKRLQ